MARLEEEKDRAVMCQKEMAKLSLGIDKECLEKVVAQIRLLNPGLQFSTKGMDVD